MSSSPDEFSTARPARDPYKERQAPWSEDAEQAVLSAMLLDADAVMRAAELLEDSMFYREGHRRIFRAMIAVTERGAVVDPLTLADELDRRGELAAAGGKAYLGVLVDAIPTAANVESHAMIVREKAILRRVIETSTDLIGEAFEGRITAADLLDEAERRMLRLAQSKSGDRAVRLKELLWPAMERIEARQQAGVQMTGVPSGFADLDDMTNGFQAGDLVIIAARPSMGKTSFAMNIALNAALDAKKKVLIFSLEMNKDSLVQRLLTSEARVDAQRLRKAQLRDDDFVRLARAAGLLGQAELLIDDASNIGMLEIRSRARRAKAESGLDMIVVDYLQFIQEPPGAESRVQAVSQISRLLKSLAKELEVPVLALSQLSRSTEQRTGESRGRPQLADLRDSGAIEQDADLVMGIYRPEVYALKEAGESGQPPQLPPGIEGLAEIILLKQRNGPVGTVELTFQKQYTRFENRSNRPAPPELAGSATRAMPLPPPRG
ncbi:MAG: replicative DNA helicase [Gemmatimonadota bacterium]